jgi:hypothetical protein
MNPKVSFIIIVVLLSAISFGMMYAIDEIILPGLGKWTIDRFGKVLIIHLTPIDKTLIRFFPLLISTFLLFSGIFNLRLTILLQLTVLTSVIFALLIGTSIGLLLWPGTNEVSPLLPEYTKQQPFTYYWTTVLALGILIPIIIVIHRYKKRS